MLAALGSFLQAKHQNGKWLVRIEDLDPPREIKGAADSILKTLEAHGLHWDEDVVYQSQRSALYQQALTTLEELSLLYACGCSRKTIKQHAKTGPIGFIYPGTCRGQNPTQAALATRLKVDVTNIQFFDGLQGLRQQNIAQQIGDIVLKRADGFYAYHLAVVVDDYEQGITEIVRGFDLIDCTPIQIYLQQTLGYHTPFYLHLPILLNNHHEKLSKQTKAQAVKADEAPQTLIRLLTLLNQNPPPELVHEKCENILEWAIKNWCLKTINQQFIEITS